MDLRSISLRAKVLASELDGLGAAPPHIVT